MAKIIMNHNKDESLKENLGSYVDNMIFIFNKLKTLKRYDKFLGSRYSVLICGLKERKNKNTLFDNETYVAEKLKTFVRALADYSARHPDIKELYRDQIVFAILNEEINIKKFDDPKRKERVESYLHELEGEEIISSISNRKWEITTKGLKLLDSYKN